MPRYDYMYEDTGDVFEVVQRMNAEALTEVDGRIVRRVPSVGNFTMGKLGQSDKYPYISNALPSTIDGCKMVRQGGRYKPLIENARHEREVAKKNNLVKD